MKVPQVNPSISMDVSGVGIAPSNFGRADEALAQAGAQLAQNSSTLLSDVTQTEAQESSAKAYYQDKLDSEAYLTNLKNQSPDGYVKDSNGDNVQNSDGTPKTITQQFHEWADQRFQDNQSKLPSHLAQDLYRQRATTFFTDQTGALKTDELLMRTESFKADRMQQAQTLGDDLASAPSLDKLYSHSNDLTQDVMAQSGKLYNATQAKEMVMKLNQHLADETIRGAYTQALAGSKTPGQTHTDIANYWQSVFAGTDKDSQIRRAQGLPILADMITPERKSIVDDKMLRLKDVAGEHDVSDTKVLVDNTVAANELGKGSPDAMNAVVSSINKLQATGKLSPVQAAENVGSLIASQAIGKIKSSGFDQLSPQDRQNLMDNQMAQTKAAIQNRIGNQPGLEDMGAVAQKKVEEAYKQALDKTASEEKTDFAAFAQKSPDYPKTKLAAATLDYSDPANLGKQAGVFNDSARELEVSAQYKYPKAPDVLRLISKDDSKRLSGFLKNPAVGDDQVAQGIKGLVQMAGPRYPKLIDQMIRDGELPPAWRLAAYQPSSLGTLDMVSAIRGSSALDKAFTDAGGDEKTLEPELRERTLNFATALIQQAPSGTMQLEVANQLRQVVSNRAKQIFLEGGGRGSISDAVSQATKSLIDDNVHVDSVGRNGLVAIPKRIGNQSVGDGDRDTVLANLQSNLTPQSLSSMGLLAPPQASGKPTEFAEQDYKMASRTGRWAYTSAPEPGFNFFYKSGLDQHEVSGFMKDPKGNLVPLFYPLKKALIPSAPVTPKPPLFPTGPGKQ